jgi:hypothetical protein
MSLFQAREWWRAPAEGGNDEVAPAAVVVGNLDNAPDGGNKLAVGTVGGLLRVWRPEAGADGPGAAILEQRLSAPVLALAAGRLSSLVDGLCLAVLSHAALSVYALDGASAGGATGAAPRLRRLYAHEFVSTGPHFSGCSMAVGPLGRGAGGAALFHAPSLLESVAVLSMDGQLAVFEQERFLFRRTLGDGALLPGPMAYEPSRDAIVVANGMSLECYTMASLSAATPQAPVGG